MEINEDQLDENRQRLFILSLLQQGTQPLSLAFWQKLKVGKGAGKLYGGIRKASDVP